MARGHALDGLVLIPNCDKIVPGMMMAAARLNIPAVMVSGGPMRTGNLDGDILDFNSIMESVGSFKNGDIDEEQLEDVAERCCPGCGSCSGLFTANSMNSLTEVLGMVFRTTEQPSATAARESVWRREPASKLWKC